MIKTLRISFDMKNTYRVNSILYWMKRLPLVGRLLPASLYRIRGLKMFANVLSVIREIIGAFLGKLIYFLLMIYIAKILYEGIPTEQVFLQSFICLTLIGGVMYSSMFHASQEAYYAVVLMNMDAREYTLGQFGYGLLKYLAGYLLFGLVLRHAVGLSVIGCLLIPAGVIGVKLFFASLELRRWERTEDTEKMILPARFGIPAVLLLLAAAYVLPKINVLLPVAVSYGILILYLLGGICCIGKLLDFQNYRTIYREVILGASYRKEDMQKMLVGVSHDNIDDEGGIKSEKKGFEYLNELFILRHRKILWRSSKRMALFCGAAIVLLIGAAMLMPGLKEEVNRITIRAIPALSLFLMYVINRGSDFTHALFANCDHSLLTYSFYKKPDSILRLFRIRLREIVKINLLPAAVIACGLDVLLLVTGGVERWEYYLMILLSILGMSVFFSLHHLALYYLLQPYDDGTQVKSLGYKISLGVTFVACHEVTQLQIPLMHFGIVVIGFCVVYGVVAAVLVYVLAPKTFRIRK